MRKYKVIMSQSSSKRVYDIGHFPTYNEAIDFVEEQRADDLKHGEADEYEYEIIIDNE